MDTKEKTYNDNYKKLYALACKMLPDADDAGDIIHDVFMDFFEKANGNHTIHYPKSWLYRATLNKCIDRLRYNKKLSRMEEAGEMINRDNVIERNEKKDLVRKAMAKLKIKERELAALYSEGLSYKEIAEITQTNPASIGKMLSRTLKKLEIELKKIGYEMHG